MPELTYCLHIFVPMSISNTEINVVKIFINRHLRFIDPTSYLKLR